MAIMHLQPNEEKNTRAMTPLEQEHARLIGSLMVCAKLLQRAALNESLGRPGDNIRESVHALISLANIYQADGQRMEQEALRLARRLGFEVEQVFFAAPAGGVH